MRGNLFNVSKHKPRDLEKEKKGGSATRPTSAILENLVKVSLIKLKNLDKEAIGIKKKGDS